MAATLSSPTRFMFREYGPIKTMMEHEQLLVGRLIPFFTKKKTLCNCPKCMRRRRRDLHGLWSHLR
jgi:hypothetical protein